MKVSIETLLQQFDRWNPIKPSSWFLRVFYQYQTEMKRMTTAYMASNKYVYRLLGANGALWSDMVSNYMDTGVHDSLILLQWSKAFNEFDNWTRLNELMALNSYLEVYISSVVSAAIESDPGLLVKSPHSIDGIKQMKYGVKIKKEFLEDIITSCTKGDWQSRVSNLSSLFGSLPISLTKRISDLEKIRIIRNKVGHAFGRDIEKSRDYAITNITRMERLSAKTFLRYMYLVQNIVHDIDNMVMVNHIGNFQPLLHYHRIRVSIPDSYNNGERMMILKKSIGKDTQETYSKAFCRWVVEYYECL